VIIFSVVGILIITKYFKYKNKAFIYVGVAWIIMGAPWCSSSFAFLVYLVNGVGLPLEIYLILGYPLLPFGLFSFGLALIELKYKDKKNLICALLIIFVIIFEAYFIFFLFSNPLELGVLTSPVNIDFGTIITIFLIVALISVVIMGILIARESFRSDDREIKLKGKFLLLAFISLLIGAAMDTILPITFITFPIIRLILIASAIEFYFGYFLPFWLKTVFLKKDNSGKKAQM